MFSKNFLTKNLWQLLLFTYGSRKWSNVSKTLHPQLVFLFYSFLATALAIFSLNSFMATDVDQLLLNMNNWSLTQNKSSLPVFCIYSWDVLLCKLPLFHKCLEYFFLFNSFDWFMCSNTCTQLDFVCRSELINLHFIVQLLLLFVDFYSCALSLFTHWDLAPVSSCWMRDL